jgi:hypothetical protein
MPADRHLHIAGADADASAVELQKGRALRAAAVLLDQLPAGMPTDRGEQVDVLALAYSMGARDAIAGARALFRNL